MIEDTDVVFITDADLEPPAVDPNGPWLMSIGHVDNSRSHAKGGSQERTPVQF